MPKSTTTPTRRAERRQRVLDATLDVIANEGVRAVTHRRVAAQAGVSLGLITYHFSSTSDLIAATLDELAQREVRRFRDLEAQISEQSLTTDQLVELLVEQVTQRSYALKREEIVGVALTLEIPRKRLPREAFDTWESAQLAMYEAIAQNIGSADPHATALFLLASIDGLSLYAAITTEPPQIEMAARSGLTRLIRGATQ